MTTLDEQLKLEFEMHRKGRERFERSQEVLKENSLIHATVGGRKLISGTVTVLADAIKARLNTPTSNRDIFIKKASAFKPEILAYMTLKECVDAMAGSQYLLSTAYALGRRLEMQQRLDEYVDDKGRFAVALLKQANEKSSYVKRKYGLTHKLNKDEVPFDKWTDSECIHVGTNLIDMAIAETGLFELSKVKARGRNKYSYCLIPTEQTFKWLEAHDESLAETACVRGPCIIPPKPWTSVSDGGWHSDFGGFVETRIVSIWG